MQSTQKNTKNEKFQTKGPLRRNKQPLKNTKQIKMKLIHENSGEEGNLAE